MSAFLIRNPKILSLLEFQMFEDRTRVNFRRRPSSRLIGTDVSSAAYLLDTLQLLFGLLSDLMLPASPNDGHYAIANAVRKHHGTRPIPIITTNYDCCIDLALLEMEVDPFYNLSFEKTLASTSQLDEKAPLIKLHGSLNWFYCGTCQAIWSVDIQQTVKDYKGDIGEFPIISVCKNCGGQRRGLLVPPQAFKFDVAPPLQRLIAQAESWFLKSSLLVVVGFSFAEADLYISRMLMKSMQESEDTKMIIIDPDVRVAAKMRRRFEAQIRDFDSEKRILQLKGDCANILPRFLEGKLYKQ